MHLNNNTKENNHIVSKGETNITDGIFVGDKKLGFDVHVAPGLVGGIRVEDFIAQFGDARTISEKEEDSDSV